MEEYENKVKGTEQEEEKRNGEQAFCGVTGGSLTWVGTYLVCPAWKGDCWGVFGYLLIFSSKPNGIHV